MEASIKVGDCVKIRDGCIARVRNRLAGKYRVRVRRKTSKTHPFLEFPAAQLEPVGCPKGWMSPDGYKSYLKVTLAKIKERNKTKQQ